MARRRLSSMKAGGASWGSEISGSLRDHARRAARTGRISMAAASRPAGVIVETLNGRGTELNSGIGRYPRPAALAETQTASAPGRSTTSKVVESASGSHAKSGGSAMPPESSGAPSMYENSTGFAHCDQALRDGAQSSKYSSLIIGFDKQS